MSLTDARPQHERLQRAVGDLPLRDERKTSLARFF
jgi:hypothetical protein